MIGQKPVWHDCIKAGELHPSASKHAGSIGAMLTFER
jgi:hypothetical protein